MSKWPPKLSINGEIKYRRRRRQRERQKRERQKIVLIRKNVERALYTFVHFFAFFCKTTP